MSRHSHLLSAICVFLGLCCPTMRCAQTDKQLVTGDDAAKQFAYQGKPVHPYCIEFSLERTSRSKPMNLATCTDTTVTPRRDDNGWLTADHPDAGQTVRGMYASYKVLAKKGNTFLLATSVCGGGSGVFESLMWVQLDEDRLAIVTEEPTGDRCGGGIADEYAVDGISIRFSRFVTPVDIIELSGIKRNTVHEGLEQTPISCFGRAYYKYDLTNGTSKLVSVQLHTGFLSPNDGNGRAEAEWTQNADSYRYQQCFNRLFNEYIDNGKADLNLTELKEFGQKFTALCVDSRQGPDK